MGCLFVIVLGSASTILIHYAGYALWVMILLAVLWLTALGVSAVFGHRGFGGGGNTDMMIVLAGSATAVALVLPHYQNARNERNAKINISQQCGGTAATLYRSLGEKKALAQAADVAGVDRYASMDSIECIAGIDTSRVLPVLVAETKDSDRLLRERAVAILRKTRDPAALPALVEALKDEDLIVRSNAANAIAEIGDGGTVPVLITVLQSGDKRGRGEAAIVLGKLGDPRAAPALITALEDHDPEVRWGAASAFAYGKLKDAQAVPALTKALRDPEVLVRVNAAAALGEIGDSSAAGALQNARKDREEAVRAKAREALQKIQGRAAPAK